MTELSNAVGRELVESITSLVKPKSNGETRRGDVTRVDPGGRTWVRIEGNDFDTCCTRSSVACKPGDSVLVSIRSNRTTIEGNYTSPATDDSMAREAIKTGSSAQQTADMAHELAANAIADAQATRDAAERAEADATRAAVAAESASISAANANESAGAAETSAEIAAAASRSAVWDAVAANVAANGAVNSLSTVEDIVGTLRWIQENRMFFAASGQFDPTKNYYQVIGANPMDVADPSACEVANPEQGKLWRYHELHVGEHFPTRDGSVVPGKTYWQLVPAMYELVENPVAEDMGGYFEIIDNAYALTTDTEPVEGKAYYAIKPSEYVEVVNPDESMMPLLYEIRPDYFAPTDDRTIDPSKTYYWQGDPVFEQVESPTTADVRGYFELEDGRYRPTADNEVDSAKAYYRIALGQYCIVREGYASAEGMADYLEVNPNATIADLLENHMAVTSRGLYITASKPRLTDGGGIDTTDAEHPDGMPYILLAADGLKIFNGIGAEIASYGEDAEWGDGMNSTTIKSKVLQLLLNGSNVFKVGTTDDGVAFFTFSDGKGHDLFTVDFTGKPTFAKPVPIGSGGTDATNRGDAADNLMVQSIGAGMEIPAGTDLNTLTTPGNYVCGFTSNVAGFANKPTPLTNAFRLTVFKVLGNTEHSANEGHRGQLIMDWTSGREYYRVYNASSGSWGSWRTKRQDTDVIDVPHGGTNSTTAAGARSNLGVPGMTYDSDSKHWLITQPDGGNANWWRVGTAGIIPPSADSTNKTGKASIGANSWYFASAYVVNYYGNWAGNTIPVGKGGSGITSNPSMLVNLASTSAASVFQASPRPGVTGTLPLSRGGLGATTAAGGRSTLGLTGSATAPYDSGCIEVAKYSSYYTGTDGNIYAKRSGGVCTVSVEGVTCKNVGTSRITIAVLPEGYRPKQSIFEHDGLEIFTNGNIQMLPNVAANQQKWISVSFALA